MSVANTTAGHVWTWILSNGITQALTTDDNGTIELIDVLAAPSKSTDVVVPGLGSVPLNAISHLDFYPMFPNAKPNFFADEHLNLIKDRASIMGFAVPPAYGTLLGFIGGQAGIPDGPLIEVLTGTRDTLFSTGLVPTSSQDASDDLKALLPDQISHDRYTPAKLIAHPPYSGPVRDSFTYARIEVGANGVPMRGTWFMGPQSTQRFVQSTVSLERFAPARLNGKPVPSIYFQAIHI